MNGDIFWRNTTTGEVGMWVMNGTKIARRWTSGRAAQLDDCRHWRL